MTDAPEFECFGGPLDGERRPCDVGESIFVGSGRYNRGYKVLSRRVRGVWTVAQAEALIWSPVPVPIA